jgi:hypothetical protein
LFAARVRRTAQVGFAGTTHGRRFDGVPSLCINAMLGRPHPVADGCWKAKQSLSSLIDTCSTNQLTER